MKFLRVRADCDKKWLRQKNILSQPFLIHQNLILTTECDKKQLSEYNRFLSHVAVFIVILSLSN